MTVMKRMQLSLKRIFDLVTSLFGLILLFPLFTVVAVMIKISMPGPVIFKQKRTGRHGELFTIYKFRTMVVGHDGDHVSVKGEHRITTLGSKLRKRKIDEFPELFNVLKGDMSLVGPRPDIPGYADKLQGEERKILKLRPGITGPASLKYASEEELLAEVSDPKKYNDEVLWPDKVRINLDYYYNMSFLGDLRLILKTIFKEDINPQKI